MLSIHSEQKTLTTGPEENYNNQSRKNDTDCQFYITYQQILLYSEMRPHYRLLLRQTGLFDKV